jgi:hypothetical protein
VTEQYTINQPSTIAFYGRYLKEIVVYSPQAFIETFSIPSSLFSVSDKSACIRQTTATI